LEKDYPNKNEWKIASKLPDTFDYINHYINHGDLPAPFTVTHTGTIEKGTTFKVANNSITITEQTYGLKWDSKTGLVLGRKDSSDTEYVPIPYTGKSFGTIPVEEDFTFAINDGSLDFQYWYY
jgi:hypothetical protein